jgi:S1-C subfamily serine protease
MNSTRFERAFRGAHATCRLLSAVAMLALASIGAQAANTEPHGTGPSQRELTVDALSVVKIKSHAVRDARSASTLGAEREGTGVVIDSNGLVLTIGYLVTEADNVELSTADGKVFPATVIGSDARTGMGLLKALLPLPVKPIDMGESASVGERELVLIVGFDGVAPAYVVSKRRFVGYWEYLLDEAIYTAPATVNWQGAALLSKDGKLLGIGSLAVGDAIGHGNIPGNMFVPIDVLKPVLGDMIANGKSTAKPRPWIGVNTQDIQGHLIVTRVSPDSPADDAGLQKGDVIVGIGGEAVQGQADFYTRLWATGQAGVDVALDVLKGNQVQTFTVKSRDRESYFRPKAVY